MRPWDCFPLRVGRQLPGLDKSREEKRREMRSETYKANRIGSRKTPAKTQLLARLFHGQPNRTLERQTHFEKKLSMRENAEASAR
jgi:hypothetical protein